MKKWYLNTWVIALMFALWFLIFPAIIGIVLLIKQHQELSAVYEKNNRIDNLEEKEMYLKNKEKRFEQDCAEREKKLNEKMFQANNDLKNIQERIANSKKELQSLTDNVFVACVSPFYFDQNIPSEEYRHQLSILRLRCNDMIKEAKHVLYDKNMADGKLVKNNKVIKNNLEQLFRCFNAETQNIINNLTTKNFNTCLSALEKSFNTLNKIFETDGISISIDLYDIKLQELMLANSYQIKKEQEKEEQKEIRAQMLEEEKVRREIEREKAKIEKEEKQFKTEISKLMGYMQKASDIEKQLYIDKIKELEEKIKLLEKDRENVLEREQNTRAGFVYVISNIGSFGEDVYKIGMTRRLEPMDRVKELGDASVPFEFDVHAMIFSEDAPSLENILHQTFRDKQVNKVNDRKEFFRVSLDEIEKVVKENYNATVTFTKIAEAAQYRESLRLAQTNAG